MKKLSIITAAIALAAAITAAPVAAESYRTEVTNNIGLGDVNIILHQMEPAEAGGEVTLTPGRVVVPGQFVDDIVRIENAAEDAWVRIKVDYASNNVESLSDDDLKGIGEKWIRKGEYYYYTEPVPHGETVTFMTGVRVPTDWTELVSGMEFSLSFKADAVQKKNFTPDFGSDDPWFGTLIELCVHDHYALDTEITEPGAFSVEFRGGAEGLIHVGEDFFSNWGRLMPGDVMEDAIEVRNDYERPIEIFFENETIADGELVDKLLLVIKNETTGETIFDGTLAEALESKVSLGTYKKGDSATISHALSVPPELTNRYALTQASTVWIYTAELKESNTTPTPTKTTPTETTPTETTPTETTPTEKTPTETTASAAPAQRGPVATSSFPSFTNAVKTGDYAAIGTYMILFLSATALVITLIRRKCHGK